MCRSTDYHNFIPRRDQYRDCLKLRGFFVRLIGLSARDALPDSLTLLYPPRADGTPLAVSGSEIRPESKAFVTLHRVVSARTEKGGVIFGSRERVRAGDGACFEVYFADQKALKGVFRRDGGGGWELECKCALDGEMVGVAAAECEVCVAVDRHAAMTERVEMVVRRKRAGFVALETIPEEREEDRGSDGCCCSCGDWEEVSDGGDSEWCDVDADDVDLTKVEVEMEMDTGVGWAVDVGLWVMCFGVGYMVSKTSAKTLRRLKIL